jgi:hypothetical protein
MLCAVAEKPVVDACDIRFDDCPTFRVWMIRFPWEDCESGAHIRVPREAPEIAPWGAA